MGSFPRSTWSHDWGLKPYPWMCCSSHGDSDRKLLLIEHRSEKTSQISTLPDFSNESQMRIARDRHNHANRGSSRKNPRTNESESSLIPADWGRRSSLSRRQQRQKIGIWGTAHRSWTTGAGTNPARKGQPAREIVRRAAPPDRILAGKRKKCSLGCAPATPRTPGRIRRIKPRTSNGQREDGAGHVGPAGSGCARARIRILRRQLRGGNGRRGRRRREKGGRGGRRAKRGFFWFFFFVVDVERNK